MKRRYVKRRKMLNPKICYPELVGTNLIVDAASTNDKCRKPVATVLGEKL